jgi:hypothetical protein
MRKLLTVLIICKYYAKISYLVMVYSWDGLQDLTVILSTLLPVVCINGDSKEHADFSVALKV